MATQQRKRNGKPGRPNAKAKRNRNAKRGDASKRQGYPGRNAPAGTLGNERKALSDAIEQRTSTMVPMPSRTTSRELNRQRTNGE